MKKLISLFLAATLVLTNFQGWNFLKEVNLFKDIGVFQGLGKLFAEEVKLLEGVGIYYTISNNEVSIADADTSISGDLVIPDTIEGYPVTAINSLAFTGCNLLESVQIPEGVTSIGAYAFKECTSLKNVQIPSGITSIEDFTFIECSSLESIEIPEGVTSIGESAFEKCKSLTNIEIPKSVTSMEKFAFAGCSSVKSINFLASVTNLERNLFAGCSSLESITLPDGVKSIGRAVFYNCKSLNNVDLPEGVTSIGQSAFSECDALTTIKIPQNITAIDIYTFEGCDNLTSVDLPEGITSIGQSAFSGCTSLKSIVIPKGITTIEEGVFKECSSLESVDIPSEVTEIKKFAFFECSSLSDIKMPKEIKNIGDSAFYGCSSLTSIKISEKIDYISSRAFKSCSSLTSALFLSKETVMTVDSTAFEECNKLTIYGYKNSYIESYARELVRMPFQGIDISLNADKLNLIKDEEYDLELTIEPGDLFTDPIEWSSSDESIVSVDQNGNIRANSIGDAVITATNKVLGTIATCEVQVSHSKITDVDIAIEKDEYYFTGEQIKPNITVKDGDMILTEGIDYTVEYGENKYVGEGSITVVGIGNYGGSKTVKFNIGRKQYVNVIFDTGTKVTTIEVAKGSALNYTPEAPTKEGYIFVGWFKNVNDITTEYNPSDICTENIIYTAKWAHVEMLGAQVKSIVNDESGIRFGTKIYNDGDEIVEKGTIILPVKLLESGKALTLDTPGIAKSIGKVNYEYNKRENYVIYLGTLISIQKEKFDEEITASSYVIYRDKSGNEYTVYAPYKNNSTTINKLLGNKL